MLIIRLIVKVTWLLFSTEVVQKANQHLLQILPGVGQVASAYQHLLPSVQLYLPADYERTLENVFFCKSIRRKK